MTRCRTERYLLPLAAAMLALPVGASAQQAPPAPTAPPAPVGPTPPPGGPSPAPTNPPTPTQPTGPPPPAGNGGIAPAMPPPPPPTPPMPGAVQAPGLAQGGGGFIPTAAIPLPPLPQNESPDVTPAGGGTPGILLRYKFLPGQVLSYQVVVDLDGNIQMGTGGTKEPLKQHLEMTLNQTVKSVDTNGAATISEKISSFTAMMNGQEIPLPAQSQQQMQQPFTVVMTPSGQVQSFKAPTGAAAFPPTGFDPSQLSQIQALPKDAVSVGDKWRSDITTAVANIETHVAYTLSNLSADGGTATIGQKIYAVFKPAKPGTVTALPVKLDGTLTGSGTQQFDVAAGQVASQTNNLTLDLNVAPSAGMQPVKTHFDITATLQRRGNGAAGPAADPTPTTNEPPTHQLQ